MCFVGLVCFVCIPLVFIVCVDVWTVDAQYVLMIKIMDVWSMMYIVYTINSKNDTQDTIRLDEFWNKRENATMLSTYLGCELRIL